MFSETFYLVFQFQQLFIEFFDVQNPFVLKINIEATVTGEDVLSNV